MAGEGEGDVIREWRIAASEVQILPPILPSGNASKVLPILPMRVKIRATLGASDIDDATQVPGLKSLRIMSAGAVIDRL